MKNLLLLLSGTVMLFVLTAYTMSTPEEQTTYAVLSVTSAIEGEEVSFEGKYFSLDPAKTEPSEVLEARQTPFQVRVDEANFYGLFRALEDGADIKLNVTMHGEDGSQVSMASAIGQVGLVMRRGRGLTTTSL